MSEKKTVLLGMPSYNGPTMAAARAFFHPTAPDGPRLTHLSYQEGSLIDESCSALWAWALNSAYKGGRVDYWAMLHADVEPPDHFLDTMIDEMEARNLDALSVAVPVKDQHGRVSAAVGRPDDVFNPLFRLTLTDVYNLPATFTAKDCNYPDNPLLVNTGCFVCKFDYRWAVNCGFSSRTKIVFDNVKRMWVVQTEPEDWHFARDLWKSGLRVGMTRKIILMHRGDTRFGNERPWGTWAYDQDRLEAPAIKPPSVAAWRFPDEIDGWLSADEGRCLADYATGKNVLEIGSYKGRSTACMSQVAKSVYCIDPFDGRATPNPEETLHQFLANVKKYSGACTVVYFVGTAAEYLDSRPPNTFDVVFIDGDHSPAAVKEDVRCALKLLRPDGLLMFHDYRRRAGDYDGRHDPGVTAAVNDLLECGGELINHVGTVAVVRPPALGRVNF